jgi:hypothetical protein
MIANITLRLPNLPWGLAKYLIVAVGERSPMPFCTFSLMHVWDDY